MEAERHWMFMVSIILGLLILFILFSALFGEGVAKKEAEDVQESVAEGPTNVEYVSEVIIEEVSEVVDLPAS